ncbi:MAG: arsenate reductase ArsC [Patulibacter sp.]
MSNVLFVCLQNAGRSQISEALFTRAVDGAGHRARSAGTTPAEHVHPEVITVMDELGIDLRDRVPQRLTQELAEWADVVVTMGCGDACPYVPGVRYLDWKLEDPSGQGVDQVRSIRDEVERRVRGLVGELSD